MAGTNLQNTAFRNTVFKNVIFKSNCNLSNADFSDATFINVNFGEGCHLDGARFQFATFGTGVKIEFDRNYIGTCTFSGQRNDSWSTLYNSYQGIWQYINLTLSGAYFAFLLLKLYLFAATSYTTHALLAPELLKQRDDVVLSEISVYDFVMGDNWTTLTIALLILLYQTVRIFLTTHIAPLIDNEIKSGYTPCQSALNIDPLSASRFDPLFSRWRLSR